MVEQTVAPNDFVIVCDGQLTSALYLVIDEFKERYPYINVIYSEKQRTGRGFKQWSELLQNDIVARMDSDDIAFPDRMRLQLDAFREQGADIVSGTVTEFEGDISNALAVKELPETPEEIKNMPAGEIRLIIPAQRSESSRFMCPEDIWSAAGSRIIIFGLECSAAAARRIIYVSRCFT